MDIIASHQSGLVEQLEAEAMGLAGRPQDSVQRAIVYHHVADMLGLSHGYALLAAEGALAIDALIARMKRQCRRWRIGLSAAERAALANRLDRFAEQLNRIDAERCAGVLMAYRLVATPGLGGEAAKRLEPGLLAALRAAQDARGQADASTRRALFDAHCHWAGARFGQRVDEAVGLLDWRLGSKAVAAAVATVLIPAASFEQAERRGLDRVEARLRGSKRLPQCFAANPAQAFFTLQRGVAERRRRGGDENHLSPDEAVKLAA